MTVPSAVETCNLSPILAIFPCVRLCVRSSAPQNQCGTSYVSKSSDHCTASTRMGLVRYSKSIQDPSLPSLCAESTNTNHLDETSLWDFVCEKTNRNYQVRAPATTHPPGTLTN